MKFETICTKGYGVIRLGWIRLLYGCTAFLGITVGSTMLIAPDFSRQVGAPFIFFPLISQGTFPEYGWASAVGNLVWMTLDIKAIPWRYLFSRDKALELAVDADEEPSCQPDQVNERRRAA